MSGQGRPPSTILGIRKLDTGYLMVKTNPSVFPHFYTIPECDEQTDGRTDGRTDVP